MVARKRRRRVTMALEARELSSDSVSLNPAE